MTGDISVVTEAIRSAGFGFAPAEQFRALLTPAALAEWLSFAASWENLGVDTHMADAARRRCRGVGPALALDHDAGATCIHRARVALIYVHVEPGTVEGKAGAQAVDRTPATAICSRRSSGDPLPSCGCMSRLRRSSYLTVRDQFCARLAQRSHHD
jgi:uncharacterized membrane protein